jgi:hypothetical protein
MSIVLDLRTHITTYCMTSADFHPPPRYPWTGSAPSKARSAWPAGTPTHCNYHDIRRCNQKQRAKFRNLALL